MRWSFSNTCSFPDWLVERVWSDGGVMYETEHNQTLTSYLANDRISTFQCLQIHRDHSHHHHLLLQTKKSTTTTTLFRKINFNTSSHTYDHSQQQNIINFNPLLHKEPLTKHTITNETIVPALILSPLTSNLPNRYQTTIPSTTTLQSNLPETFIVVVRVSNLWLVV